MPIDPKQQPPYYTPATTGTNTTKFLRLNTQYTAVQTSGTNETDLYLYTIPANTLTQNGDTLNIEFTVLQSTGAGLGENNLTQFYLGGSSQGTTNSTGTWTAPQTMRWIIQAIRISSSSIRLNMQTFGQTQVGAIQFQDVTALDFTNTIPIKFTGQCPTTGQLQAYSLTIDKITI